VIEWAFLLAFATWRVTSLLHFEKPFGWLRNLLGIEYDEETKTMAYPCNLIGEIWECFWCLSLVVSFVLVLFCYIFTDLNIFEALIVWLASAGGALCLDVRFFARLRG
jgi:hypothetical protein